MAAPTPYQPEVLEWHPNLGGEAGEPVPLNFVCGELAVRSRAQVLFVTGFGERLPSARAAVAITEKEYGVPAAAAWLSYVAMPDTEARRDAVSRDAPLALARHVGHEESVHLVTNSLGCLTIDAARNTPEMFVGVGVMAPYAFAYRRLGHIPVIGSNPVTRAVAMGWRLGVRTPLQLAHRVFDADVRGVVGGAKGELDALAEHWWGASSHAFDPETGQETTESFMWLASRGHPVRAVFARRDCVAPFSEALPAMRDAAKTMGVDQAGLCDMVVRPPGMHAPWCSPEGKKQLRYRNWLPDLLSQRVTQPAV